MDVKNRPTPEGRRNRQVPFEVLCRTEHPWAMVHSNGMPKYGSGTPRTPTTPTFEQLLQASSDGSRWSGTNSPTYNRENDGKDHGHDYQRKSILANVKDRARRWRQNLGKKKGVDQDNGTPSWGVSLEEDDDSEDNAEYLGAPMYESELAPEDCRENARQHPRANPVISEKRILLNSPRQGDPLPTNTSTSPNKSVAASLSGPNCDNASMTQGLNIEDQPGAASGGRVDVGVTRQNLASSKQYTWDKGISVREYLSHKLEPGEDDRALSRVITEAMSPRKARGHGNSPNNVGIVEKFKDAVSSFLHAGESSSSGNDYLVPCRAPISNTTPEIVEEEPWKDSPSQLNTIRSKACGLLLMQTR